MPPLLADFTHARPCKPFCEKYLTLPIKGLQNKLAQCRTLGMILLVLAVLGLIFSGFRFTWSNVTAIVLPILYLLGAKKQD